MSAARVGAWAPRERLLALLLACLVGWLAGAFAVVEARVLNLPFRASPELAIAAVLGLVLLFAIVRRPSLGVIVLVVVVESNLSEVLVRVHGLPSVLQLLVPVLLLVLALAWMSRTEASRRTLKTAGLDPHALAFVGATAGYLAVLHASRAWALDQSLAGKSMTETAKAAFLACMLAIVVDERRAWRRVIWALVLTGSVLAACSSFQVLSGNWELTFGGLAGVKVAHIAGRSFSPRATGPISDPNFYAQALLVLVPLALAQAAAAPGVLARRVGLACAGVLTIGIATTYSRGGALALFVVLLLFAWQRRKSVRSSHLVAAGVLGIALLAILPSTQFARRLETLSLLLPGEQSGLQRHDSSMNKRRVVMGAAALMALDHPLLGVGAGNYTTWFNEYADQIGASGRIYNLVGAKAFAHCLYLEVLAETGLLGALALAAVIACAFRCTLVAARRFERLGDQEAALLARALALGLIGYLTSSLLLHGDYQRYLWLLLGACVASAAVSARALRDAAPSQVAPE